MTTKEQERKALEQIRKIIAGLGDLSYIGTALEGCLEIADQNIEYDFADSMKGRVEIADKKVKELTSQIEHLQGVRQHIEKQLQDMTKQSEQNFQSACDKATEIRDLKGQLEAAQNRATEAEEAITEVTAKAQQTIDRQADEIIRLKAKLYDLMTK